MKETKKQKARRYTLSITLTAWQRAQDEIAEGNRVIAELRKENASLRVDNRAGDAQLQGTQKELTDARQALAAEETRFRCMSDRLLRQEKIIEKQQGTITMLRAVAQAMLDIAVQPTPMSRVLPPLPDGRQFTWGGDGKIHPVT